MGTGEFGGWPRLYDYTMCVSHGEQKDYRALPYDCSAAPSEVFVGHYNTGHFMELCAAANRVWWFNCHDQGSGTWDDFLSGFGPGGAADSYEHIHYSPEPGVQWQSEHVSIRPTFCIRSTPTDVCRDANPTGSYMSWPDQLIPEFLQV